MVQEAIGLLASGSYDKFSEYISNLDPDLQTQITSMITGIDEKSPEVQEAIRLMATGSETEFKTAINKMTPDMQAELLAVIGELDENDPILKAIAQSMGIDIAKGFDQSGEAITATDNVLAAVEKEIKDNTDVETEAETQGKSIGKAFNQKQEGINSGYGLLDGVKTGISDTKSQSYTGLFGKIGLVTSSIVTAFKAGLKENSPSKATEEMGGFLLEGLANGIRDNVNVAVKAAGLASEEVLDAMDISTAGTKIQSALSNELGTAKASLNSSLDMSNAIKGTNKIINYNQTIYSPKAVSRLDIYRQSKNAVSVLGEV